MVVSLLAMLRAPLRMLVVGTLLAGALVATAPAPPAEAGGCSAMFPASYQDELATRYPGQRITAAVYDTRTGCSYHLNRGMTITTASVIKAQFLAGVLLRAQDQGRGVTTWERDRIVPMMSFSHNPPATDLFLSLGGIDGQEALDQRFGLGSTTSSNHWGATVSTAEDRTKLALVLLHGGGPLGASGRSQAWQYMTAVHPTQQWGVTAGVPAGWSVALKNGFYPMSGFARWRIGSTGFVRHDATGQGYAVTIQSDRNPDHHAGQRLVEDVSRHIASRLTDGPGAARPVDRSVCTQTGGNESWSTVAARLGTSDVAGVRSVSGGPSSPLAGMRACRPDLRVVYDPAGPTAQFVRAAYRTFLGRLPSDTVLRDRTVAIDSGRRSRADLTGELARSIEWIGRSVDALFRGALGRPVDAAGLRYWRDRVVEGMRLTDVGVYVLASDEFFRRNGATPESFVRALYRQILHRPADVAGLRYWLGTLQRGAGRDVVAASFYASIESRRDRVTRTYRSVLGRDPDAGGLAYWADRLLVLDDVDLAAYLASSAEYFARAQR